jgi:hypothetical protein
MSAESRHSTATLTRLRQELDEGERRPCPPRAVLEPTRLVAKLKLDLHAIAGVRMAAIALVLLAGCADPPSGTLAEPVVVSDSSGVRIVEIAPAAFEQVPVFSLGSPDLVLGTDDGDPSALLGRVRAATLLPGGEVAVGDAHGTRVLIFSPRGQLLHTVARRGEGPGELTSVTTMASRGDTLLVFDAASWKVVSFAPDGRLHGEVRLQPHTPFANKAFGPPGPDGVFVHWWRAHWLRAGASPEWGTRTGLLADSLLTVVDRISPERQVRVDSLRATRTGYAELPEEVYTREDAVAGDDLALSAVMPSPFEGRDHVGLHSGGAILGHSGTFELRRFGVEGELQQVLRGSPPRIAASDWSSGVLADLYLLSIRDRALHDLARRLSRAVGTPEVLPFFSAILAGVDGAIWLAVSAGPPSAESADWIEWLGLSPEGVPTLRLRVPVELEILEFGARHVLGLHRDALEVETVRQYEIPAVPGPSSVSAGRD